MTPEERARSICPPEEYDGGCYDYEKVYLPRAVAAIRAAEGDALEGAVIRVEKCSAMVMGAGRVWRTNDDGSVSEILPETYWVRVDEGINAIRSTR